MSYVSAAASLNHASCRRHQRTLPQRHSLQQVLVTIASHRSTARRRGGATQCH